jgi:hypothetical protein
MVRRKKCLLSTWCAPLFPYLCDRDFKLLMLLVDDLNAHLVNASSCIRYIMILAHTLQVNMRGHLSMFVHKSSRTHRSTSDSPLTLPPLQPFEA